MPKIRSHSGTKKRVRKTGSGKYAVRRNSRNHLLMQKNKRQKRMNRTITLPGTETPRLRGLVPYL